MSTEQIFTNGRIVTRDSEFVGTVVVRDGRIVEVWNPKPSPGLWG